MTGSFRILIYRTVCWFPQAAFLEMEFLSEMVSTLMVLRHISVCYLKKNINFLPHWQGMRMYLPYLFTHWSSQSDWYFPILMKSDLIVFVFLLLKVKLIKSFVFLLPILLPHLPLWIVGDLIFLLGYSFWGNLQSSYVWNTDSYLTCCKWGLLSNWHLSQKLGMHFHHWKFFNLYSLEINIFF